jgi:hypothetical protein
MNRIENKLDLHGFRYIDVPRVVDQFIGAHIIAGTHEITIITGNSPTMKLLVAEIASDYNCKIEDVWGNYGSVVINLR